METPAVTVTSPIRRFLSLWLAVLILSIFPGLTVSPAGAQFFGEIPCGIVDAIDYPVDSVEDVTIASGYDDFGRYRTRFAGNHVGLDVAFREQGEPVRAVARGRVTYSDIEGWDTERGVVIIEHVFPDASRYYTIYGHVEETDTISLPEVGQCVERGDAIAAVGWPSLSAPHMHYEVRDFLPNDGGPGYIDGNPLTAGWYHPLDFTLLWRVRLSAAFIDYVSFELVPSLPPVLLANGSIVIASGNIVAVYAPPGHLMWRMSMDDLVNGIATPGENLVVARTNSGQTATLSSGRYAALWTVEGPDEPFVVLNNVLIFVTEGGDLTAYNPQGEHQWSLNAPSGSSDRVIHFEANGSTVAFALEVAGGILWRVLDSAGTVLHEMTFRTSLLAAPVIDGSWTLLADGELMRVSGGDQQSIGRVTVRPQRTARLTADVVGNVYLYVGDAEDSLISWDSSGQIRWQTNYPALSEMRLAPLLRVDSGCLLYGLDVDGQLSVFNAVDGSEVKQTALYPGGSQTGRPNARLLLTERNGHVRFGAGFLTVVTLDGNILGGEALTSCLLG